MRRYYLVTTYTSIVFLFLCFCTFYEAYSDTKVNTTEFRISPTGTIQPNTPVTVTVNASSTAGGQIYYKFYYCGNYGTSQYQTSSWVEVQGYSTSNSATYSFPQAGDYIVVVRAVTDPNNEPTALPIIGGVVSVVSNETPHEIPQKPYNQIQTERLIGKWIFTYTIISTWSDVFTLPATVQEFSDSSGRYGIFGFDEYGNSRVLASYSPVLKKFTLLNTSGSLFDQFFVFDFIGENSVSGCYYQSGKDDSNLGPCYSMIGSRIQNYSLFTPTLKNSNKQLSYEEKEKYLAEEAEAHRVARSLLPSNPTESETSQNDIDVIEQFEALREILQNKAQEQPEQTSIKEKTNRTSNAIERVKQTFCNH